MRCAVAPNQRHLRTDVIVSRTAWGCIVSAALGCRIIPPRYRLWIQVLDTARVLRVERWTAVSNLA
eukprot:5974506-Amphidinium_carterae.2